MIIAIPVNENRDDTDICVSFGRAPFFLFHDTDTGKSELVSNSAAQAPGGAGIKAAQFVVDKGAKALITPRCGEKFRTGAQSRRYRHLSEPGYRCRAKPCCAESRKTHAVRQLSRRFSRTPMKIAVLSGKGGTGKTFVSVNLAAVAGQAVYVDCDVEEPNGRLFFKPENPKEESVFTLLPTFDETKCNGCRKCVDFCRFNALVFVKNKPMVFPEICHACGGCVLVCPNGAVSETKRTVGVIETGQSGEVRVVTGVLNTGEASGIPVIKAVLHKADPDGLTVVDCPPGSSCSVMESVFDADFCILVAEPTAFGLHNLEMVYKLVRIFKKPLGIVINKADEPYRALETFCAQNQIPILCRIPYSNKLATLCAHAEIAVMQDSESRRLFTQLLEIVCKEMGVQV